MNVEYFKIGGVYKTHPTYSFRLNCSASFTDFMIAPIEVNTFITCVDIFKVNDIDRGDDKFYKFIYNNEFCYLSHQIIDMRFYLGEPTGIIISKKTKLPKEYL